MLFQGIKILISWIYLFLHYICFLPVLACSYLRIQPEVCSPEYLSDSLPTYSYSLKLGNSVLTNKSKKRKTSGDNLIVGGLKWYRCTWLQNMASATCFHVGDGWINTHNPNSGTTAFQCQAIPLCDGIPEGCEDCVFLEGILGFVACHLESDVIGEFINSFIGIVLGFFVHVQFIRL